MAIMTAQSTLRLNQPVSQTTFVMLFRKQYTVVQVLHFEDELQTNLHAHCSQNTQKHVLRK